MSANSPTLRPSQAETASPPNSREDATTATSMSPVAGNGTTAADHHPVPESQQQHHQQQQEAFSSRASTPDVQNPARAETAASPEPVDGNTQHPIVNVVPAAAPAAAPTAATAPAPVMETTTPIKDMKSASSPPIESSVASLSITLLLISGVRHQFTMDEAYLEQHSVKAQSGKESLRDPFEMSVWQLKECIWKDWRDEWDQRPASAMFIRLIHFGRMLEDRHPLKDCRLNQDSPNVVHMTVRPPEVGDDEMTQRSAKGGFGHSRENGTGGSTPSCRCVIL